MNHLEKQILDIIEKRYKHKYIGGIHVTKLLSGYKLVLDLGNPDKRVIQIACDFDNEEDRVKFFSQKIDKELRGKYDFIFIDVPPTFGLSNDTAFYACDQLVIVLQTQQMGLFLHRFC